MPATVPSTCRWEPSGRRLSKAELGPLERPGTDLSGLTEGYPLNWVGRLRLELGGLHLVAGVSPPRPYPCQARYALETSLKEGWSEFLDRYVWDAFVTVTYRDARLPHHADSSLNEIAKVLRRHTHRHFFLGGELHVNRSLHVHGLLQLSAADPAAKRVQGRDLWRELFERFGRSQVSPVQANEAVSIYVSKYCVKDLNSWLMS